MYFGIFLGRPNITLAPGNKLPPPVKPDAEQPSKLDVLSDSVMDSKALNDQVRQISFPTYFTIKKFPLITFIV